MQNGSRDKTIAIDAMGGDNAPDEIIKGIKTLNSSEATFLLFGNKDILQPLLKKYEVATSRIKIIHADQAISSDMPVLSAIKMYKSSSMGMAIDAVKNGEADVVVSAGNTGVLMALSKIILKTINGIDRPALASIIPGKNGKTIVLDLGANAECTVRNLVEFAIMGEALACAFFAKSAPSLALLNIGSENIKGSQLVKNSASILQDLFTNYVGYIEGNNLVNGDIDVVVTDGFSGNIALKAIEGAAKLVLEEFRSIFKGGGLLPKIAACLLMRALSKLSDKYNPKLHNGAILLGLNGLVVKAHGNSDAVAFSTAIKFAERVLSDNVLYRISERLENDSLLNKINEI